MAIIDDLMNGIDEDCPVKEVLVGTFDCMVTSLRTGISSTFRDSCGPGVRGQGGRPRGATGAGDLIGMSAKELASYARSERLIDASIGIAALNSLVRLDPASLIEVNAFTIIEERGRGKKVGVVGHFPFVKRLATSCDLSVIQKAPWQGDEALREAAETLPGCAVAAITASSLINHTFDRLLELCRDSFVIVLGPSTPLASVLFDSGVDVLCGTVVEDRDLARRCITEGANYRDIRGIRRTAMLKSRA